MEIEKLTIFVRLAQGDPMNENTATTRTISLNGDWSIANVGAQLQPLANQLAGLRAAGANVRQVEVNLADIETIDASGMQLIALFLRHVRMAGVEPVFVNPTHEFLASISLLGFEADFEELLVDAVRNAA